jgi:hypothetical protein
MRISEERLESLITANSLRLFHFGRGLKHLSVPFTMQFALYIRRNADGETGGQV